MGRETSDNERKISDRAGQRHGPRPFLIRPRAFHVDFTFNLWALSSPPLFDFFLFFCFSTDHDRRVQMHSHATPTPCRQSPNRTLITSLAFLPPKSHHSTFVPGASWPTISPFSYGIIPDVCVHSRALCTDKFTSKVPADAANASLAWSVGKNNFKKTSKQGFMLYDKNTRPNNNWKSASRDTWNLTTSPPDLNSEKLHRGEMSQQRDISHFTIRFVCLQHI